MKIDKIDVAKIGRPIGLSGFLKLNLITDFPEQFENGSIFLSKIGNLEVDKFNIKKSQIKFVNYNTREDAAKLTNLIISTTDKKTRENCKLNKNEFFWFDIIDCTIVENGKILGSVENINRLNIDDYLEIKVDSTLTKQGFSKKLMLPYNARTIVSTDINKKEITVLGAFDILEALKN